MGTSESAADRALADGLERVLPRHVLEELWRADLDSSDLSGRDPAFIDRYGRRVCDWLRRYFRAEVQGLDQVPEPPFIAVATHSGGPLLPDVWPIASLWWDLFPTEQPSYALVHDLAFRVPLVGNLLIKLGALRASRDNAERVLDAGGVLLITPGGDAEAIRSYRARNRVDLGGHDTFVQLAFRYGLPVVPVVNVGGHEVYLTVLSSERLARLTGAQRRLRLKRLNVNLGLPWGIWATPFVPYLPLPSRITYRVGPPFDFPRSEHLAANPHAVRAGYRSVHASMQGMVDELAAARRYPVVG